MTNVQRDEGTWRRQIAFLTWRLQTCVSAVLLDTIIHARFLLVTTTMCTTTDQQLRSKPLLERRQITRCEGIEDTWHPYLSSLVCFIVLVMWWHLTIFLSEFHPSDARQVFWLYRRAGRSRWSDIFLSLLFSVPYGNPAPKLVRRVVSDLLFIYSWHTCKKRRLAPRHIRPDGRPRGIPNMRCGWRTNPVKGIISAYWFWRATL